ncbi:MAG: glycosyltransferase family 39 protein [Thermoanaerobaculaceae bacterium]
MPRPQTERWQWAALALAAMAPRVAGAILRRPWHDEYFTAWVSKLPLADLVAALRLDSGPPLPYLLVKLLATLGIEPLAAARTISVAAGTAAVLLAAQAARRAFGDRAGWWTGALVAVHPLAVAWSCEGRAYALVLLAAAWAWERMEALAHGEGGAVGLASALALAGWSHALGMVLAVAAVAVALLLPRPARDRAVAAVAAGLASQIPWLPVAVHQPAAAIAWMAGAWQTLTLVGKIAAPVRLLSPLGGFAAFLDLASAPAWVEVVGASLVLALLGAACSGACPVRRPLVGFLLPAAVLGGLVALGVPVLYPGRAEAISLVPFLVLLGAGASGRRPSRVVAAAVVLSAAAVTAASLLLWAGQPASSEQRLAAALRAGLPGGGVVVIGGYWRLGIAYHLGRDRTVFDLANYPTSAQAHPGWYDPQVDRPAPGELDRLLVELRPQVRRTAVVVAPGMATASDLQRLADALGLSPRLAVPGARLLVPRARPGDRSGPG